MPAVVKDLEIQQRHGPQAARAWGDHGRGGEMLPLTKHHFFNSK